MWIFLQTVYFWHIIFTGFQNICPNFVFILEATIVLYTQDTASVIPRMYNTQSNLKVIVRIFHSVVSWDTFALKIQPQRQLERDKI